MKELSQHIKERIEMHGQSEAKKTIRYIGRVVLHPGQKYWQLDIEKAIITEAQYEDIAIPFNGTAAKRRLVIKPACIYVAAINKKVAEKKFILSAVKPTSL